MYIDPTLLQRLFASNTPPPISSLSSLVPPIYCRYGLPQMLPRLPTYTLKHQRAPGRVLSYVRSIHLHDVFWPSH